MAETGLPTWVFASLFLSLRIGPALAFAPPFTLTRMPVVFRMLLALGMSAVMAASNPTGATIADFGAGPLLAMALRELMLGVVVVAAFQLMFAALYMAGRAVDIQAGFGLAALLDPTTRSQTPLIGTLYVYAASAVFFALNGHHDLMRLFAASLEAVPLGGGELPQSLARLTAFISTVFLIGAGVAGGAVLTLFLADMAIALMSRTAPQMNVLVLGFQVKTLLLLLVLPLTFGFAGALFARMARLTLESIPGLL